MKSFEYHQSTKIVFGKGTINKLGEYAASFGKKVLLVTTNASNEALSKQYSRVIKIMTNHGLDVKHFDGVIPNPNLECIAAGSELARSFKADLIVGMGGGSSMDTAKAISVEATHEGNCWEYLFYKENQPDKKKLLPVIAVSTTSGTGSQVTQVAVVTNPETRDKSAIFNNNIYPEIAIVDPELMVSVPAFVTACTGFDVFCHAFESILNSGNGSYTDLMGWEAIRIVIGTLPALLKDLKSVELRERMSWADTLAGLCIANAGVCLPHGMCMAIGGMYPKVAHGEALAIVYPACMKFTKDSDIDNFRKLAILFDEKYLDYSIGDAADAAVSEIINFLDKIKLNKTLSSVSVPEEEIEQLAKQCMVLPDYKSNPRVASEAEMLKLVRDSY